MKGKITVNNDIDLSVQNEYVEKLKQIINSIFVDAPPLAHVHSFVVSKC